MSLQMRNQTSGLLERVAGFTDVDTILNNSSSNAIANKTVYNALAQKIDKTVTDLVNYYDKSQLYTRTEVRDLIGSINTLTIEVVATLPTSEISSTTIYFVGPKAGTTNTYDEYIYVNGTWVQIGDTTIDLSNYITSAQLTTALQNYYTKTATDNLFNDYYDKDTVDDLLDLKQDALTFDNLPTSGSSNPVTSTGIRTAISNAIVSSAGGSIIKVHHLDGGTVAGDTVTASKGSFSVSATFDNNGDAIIIGVGEIGTIQVTATNGTDIGVAFINAPSFSLYSTTISYGVNYKSWVEAGGLNPSSYSSLDEVLEDEEAIRRLFTIHASVDYLVAAIISDDNEDAIKIFNNNLCAKWISLRDYAMDTLPTNEHIATMMEDADKYGYGEWALMPQVPTMTSDTAPYGTVSKVNEYSSSYAAYMAFDNNDSTYWLPGTNSLTSRYYWLRYQFGGSIKAIVNKVHLHCTLDDGVTTTAYIQGYNGSSWVDIDTINITKADDYYVIENSTEYYGYGINFENVTHYSSDHSTGNVSIYTLQFYAWAPKGNVPVMTSNTAPYGTVTVSSSHSSIGTSWKAFDNDITSGWMANSYTNSYIAYNFINPICIKGVKICSYAYDSLGQQYARIKNFIIQGSNDNINWDNLYSGIYSNDSDQRTIPQFFEFENIDYYTYYRLYINESWSSDEYIGISYLQFYGREMKVSVPKMTGYTTPYGEVIYGSQQSTYEAWRAFDKIVPAVTDSSNAWYSNGVANDYIGYDFKQKVNIKWVSFRARYVNSAYNTIKNYIIQGSDTGTSDDWHDILEDIYPSSNTNFIIKQINANYRFFRLFIKDTYNNLNICVQEMYLFGFDYSERDWDTEYPKTYIYDHGIKLDNYSISKSSNSIVTETPNYIYYKTVGGDAYVVFDKNLSDYNLLKVYIDKEVGTSVSTNPLVFNIFNGSTLIATANPSMTLYYPYNSSINVNNINQSATIKIGQSSASNTYYGTLTEIWLE